MAWGDAFGFGGGYRKDPFSFDMGSETFDPSGYNTSFLKQSDIDFSPGFLDTSPESVIETARNRTGYNQFMEDYEPSSMLRKFVDLSQERPRREEYQPTKWGTALAAISGGLEGLQKGPTAGIKAALGVRDLPYTRATEEYQARLKDIEDALKLEQEEQKIKGLTGYRLGQLSDKEATQEWRRLETERKQKADIARDVLGWGRVGATREATGERGREFDVRWTTMKPYYEAQTAATPIRAEAAAETARAATTRAGTGERRETRLEAAPPKPKKRQESFNTMEDERNARKWAYEQFFREQDPSFRKFAGEKPGSLVNPEGLSRVDKDAYNYMQRKMEQMTKNYLKQHPRYRMVEEPTAPQFGAGERPY